MKYFIVGVIIIVLVATAFWAGYKSGEKTTPTPTPSSSVSQSVSPIIVATTTPSALPNNAPQPPLIDKRGSTGGDRVVGNRSGNLAPDFRLKNQQGDDVSLRDYLGVVPVRLIFSQLRELQFQAGTHNFTLRDPNDAIHYLYAVTSMPYTVEIDEHGIIR